MIPTTVTIGPTPLPTMNPMAVGTIVSAAALPLAGTSTPKDSALLTMTPMQVTPGPTSSTTATVFPSPEPPLAAAATAAAGAPAVGAGVGFAGVLLAAAVVATWNVWLARRRSREEERSRQRTAFAEAFKAYGRYREMPYAIRRRSGDEPADERVRLSEVARDIQAELTYHQSWMDLESSDVASAYHALLSELRKVAGGHMREAWTRPAITADNEMNIVIDMGSLAALEAAYLDSVRQHLLRLAPWWCH